MNSTVSCALFPRDSWVRGRFFFYEYRKAACLIEYARLTPFLPYRPVQSCIPTSSLPTFSCGLRLLIKSFFSESTSVCQRRTLEHLYSRNATYVCVCVCASCSPKDIPWFVSDTLPFDFVYVTLPSDLGVTSSNLTVEYMVPFICQLGYRFTERQGLFRPTL